MSKKSKKNNAKKEQMIKKPNYMVPLLVTGIIVLFIALFGFQMASEKSTNISGLSPGTPAPEFTLESTKGQISLADYKGKKNVVLYFYEGNS